MMYRNEEQIKHTTNIIQTLWFTNCVRSFHFILFCNSTLAYDSYIILDIFAAYLSRSLNTYNNNMDLCETLLAKDEHTFFFHYLWKRFFINKSSAVWVLISFFFCLMFEKWIDLFMKIEIRSYFDCILLDVFFFFHLKINGIQLFHGAGHFSLARLHDVLLWFLTSVLYTCTKCIIILLLNNIKQKTSTSQIFFVVWHKLHLIHVNFIMSFHLTVLFFSHFENHSIHVLYSVVSFSWATIGRMQSIIIPLSLTRPMLIFWTLYSKCRNLITIYCAHVKRDV